MPPSTATSPFRSSTPLPSRHHASHFAADLSRRHAFFRFSSQISPLPACRQTRLPSHGIALSCHHKQHPPPHPLIAIAATGIKSAATAPLQQYHSRAVRHSPLSPEYRHADNRIPTRRHTNAATTATANSRCLTAATFFLPAAASQIHKTDGSRYRHCRSGSLPPPLASTCSTPPLHSPPTVLP